jgi:hypothetical protein
MKTSSDTFFRIWLALQLGTIATSWGWGWQLGSNQLGFQLGVAI